MAWLVGEFGRDEKRRGLLQTTIDKRRLLLIAFEKAVPFETATAADIESFLDAREPIAPRTRYDWLSTLHAFYEWAVRAGIVDSDPTVDIPRPRLRPGLPRPISDEDLEMALACSTGHMKAWLALGAYAGLRCAEIAGLLRESVLEVHGMLRVLGKGQRERLVPIHPLVESALRACGLPRSGHIFLHNGQPFTPAKVSREISRFLTDLSIDATAHQLRHSFATRVYAACHDVMVTQALLGHSSPSTTAVYTKFSNVLAQEAVRALT